MFSILTILLEPLPQHIFLIIIGNMSVVVLRVAGCLSCFSTNLLWLKKHRK